MFGELVVLSFLEGRIVLPRSLLMKVLSEGLKQSLDKDLIVENTMQVGSHTMISDAVALKTAIRHLD